MDSGERRRVRDRIGRFGWRPVVVALFVLTAGVGPVAVGGVAADAGSEVSVQQSSGTPANGSNADFDPWRTTRAGSACTDITSSGHYTLTRNVTNSHQQYCINITADDVTFDGMGHVIDGVGGGNLSNAGPHPPVGIRVTGENVTVTNVTVTDWMTGVVFRNATGFVFHSNVTNADLDGIVVRDSTAELRWNDVTADDDGIQLTNSTVAVTDTNITNGDDTDLQRGIRANDGSEAFVMTTTIENAAITGILLNTFSEGQIRTTTINDSDVGIEVSSDSTGFLAGGEIRGSDSDGIRVEWGSKFNVTHSNVTNVGESAVVFGPRAQTNNAQIHDNNFVGVTDYGVLNRNQSATVDATGNYWGDATGPSSNVSDADAPFEDPDTGAAADGSGAMVSEGSTPGVSNVKFDPVLSGSLTTTATPSNPTTIDSTATTKALGGTTQTGTAVGGTETGSTETEGTATDTETPGFTPAIAVAALVVALFAARRRES